MYEILTKNSKKDQTADLIFPQLEKQGRNAPPKNLPSLKN